LGLRDGDVAAAGAVDHPTRQGEHGDDFDMLVERPAEQVLQPAGLPPCLIEPEVFAAMRIVEAMAVVDDFGGRTRAVEGRPFAPGLGLDGVDDRGRDDDVVDVAVLVGRAIVVDEEAVLGEGGEAFGDEPFAIVAEFADCGVR